MGSVLGGSAGRRRAGRCGGRGGCKGKRDSVLTTLVSEGGLPPPYDEQHLSRRTVIATHRHRQRRGAAGALEDAARVPSCEGRNRWCVATYHAVKRRGRKKERKEGPTKENANEQTNERDKLGGLGVGGIHA